MVLENLRAEWSAIRRFDPAPGPEPVPVRTLLGVILLGALVVRALFAFRGLPYLHSWDEPFIVSRALDMLKNGRLDPEFFVYGSLPIYASMAVSLLHYLFLMGRPETSPPFLSHIDQITTYHDTGWFWEISHPSFYLWSRWAAAAAGVGTVLLVYLIARRFAGRWAGLLAAALLAFQTFHVEHSSIATVDNPMTFFVLLAAWAALACLDRGRIRLLLVSLAACGLAASCKYTAAVSVVMPALALLIFSRGLSPSRRWMAAAALPLVPALAFLAGTPYALLNMRGFLIDLGKAVRVYEATPWAQSRVSPGVDHLVLQGGRLLESMGFVAVILALAGVAIIASRKRGWIVVSYGLIHTLLIGTSELGYHRNFLVLYPLAAVAFGAGSLLALRWIRENARRWEGRLRMAPAAAVLVVLSLLSWSAVSSFVDGAAYLRVPESRSQAAGLIRETVLRDKEARVAVPTEVRLHADDLRGAGSAVETGDYLDLLCRQNEFTHVLIPTRWSAYAVKHRKRAEIYGRVAPSGVVSRKLTRGVAPLLIDAPSLSPHLELLYAPPDEDGIGTPCVADFDPSRLLMSEPWATRKNGEVVMIRDGYVDTGWLLAGSGEHLLVLRGWATRAAGEFARVRMTVTRRGDDGAEEVLALEEFELRREAGVEAVAFQMPGEGLVSARVEFFNDIYDEANRRSRDVYLQRLMIFDLSVVDAEVRD